MTSQQTSATAPRKANAASHFEAKSELTAELRLAAQDVVDRWAKGDLAGAVQHLGSVLREFDELDGEA